MKKERIRNLVLKSEVEVDIKHPTTILPNGLGISMPMILTGLISSNEDIDKLIEWNLDNSFPGIDIYAKVVNCGMCIMSNCYITNFDRMDEKIEVKFSIDRMEKLELGIIELLDKRISEGWDRDSIVNICIVERVDRELIKMFGSERLKGLMKL